MATTTDNRFDIAIADFNSTGIRQFAEAGGAQYMREVASEGKNDSRAVLYHLDNDSYAIDTNGDPILFADEDEMRQALRDWATTRTPGIPVTDDNDTPGLFGQCSEWEHLMWACYAPKSDVDSWLESWQRDAEGWGP